PGHQAGHGEDTGGCARVARVHHGEGRGLLDVPDLLRRDLIWAPATDRRVPSAGFAGAIDSWGEASERGRRPPPKPRPRTSRCTRCPDGGVVCAAPCSPVGG